jgi:hypothetical protein
MPDHAYRMYIEANERMHDADLLAQSMQAKSDSQAVLRILAFEVLLKCALLLCNLTPKKNHKYRSLWLALPGYAQKEILSVAVDRMPGHTDLTDIEKLLGWYQFIFEKARYYYEFYENYTLDEQRELGKYWLELDAPTNEAEVQYYPSELQCLIDGLNAFVEARLSNHQVHGTKKPTRDP